MDLWAGVRREVCIPKIVSGISVGVEVLGFQQPGVLHKSVGTPWVVGV